MATEQVLPEMTELNVYQSNSESFKNSITQDPTKTAEFFLSNPVLKKDSEAACRIVEYLPLEKKLIALNSILDACASGKLSIIQSFDFFEPLYTDSYQVAPPNMQMACNYYVPAINKLYQKAAKIFDKDEKIKQKLDAILSGRSRKKIIQDSLLSSWYMGPVPFLSPNKGYWASLPADKHYSFEEQCQLIDQHVKLVDQAYESLLSLLKGQVNEDEGIKLYKLKLEQLKKHCLEFEKLRPLKDTSKQYELLIKYMDELSYSLIFNMKALRPIADKRQKNELFDQLRFQMIDLLYPDSYLLEWSAALPLSEEERYGPKMKKLAEEYKKTLNSSQ